MLARRRARGLIVPGALVLVLAACAGGPGPGETGYAYNVDGRYSGRLAVEGEPFDATFDVATADGGRVRGSFAVRDPLQIEGDIEGVVIDDLLRLTLRYDTRANGGADCPGRIEGILTISPGGDEVDGPVTVTDCVDELVGRLSFRRAGPPVRPR